MIDRITAFFKQFLTSLNKLKGVQKVVIATVVLTFIVFIVITIQYSAKQDFVYLFKKPLSLKDYGIVSAELQKLNEDFRTLNDRYILVKDEATGSRIRMSLAQNNLLPESIKGWELFDMESWTTTEFDRNVKLRRAIEGEIKRHIQSINWIENAEVSIAIPERSLYTERDKDVTAAITIQPAEGFHEYLKKKKLIMGIKNIVSKGIDGINIDNIIITDNNGNELSNFSDDDYEKNIKQAIEENNIKDKEVRKIKKEVENALFGVLASDRYRVAVAIEMNFNQESVNQKEILPIIIKKRTPGLPYDDSVIRDTLKISSKTVDENFEGIGFIPEGPPGVEDNVPPGYKESLDGRNKYSKKENIDNFVNGEKRITHKEDATDIERKSVSVSVDGHWQEVHDEEGNLVVENNSIKRKYIPIDSETLKKIEEVVKGAISHNIKRDDLVVVENIPFDRTEEFRKRDAEYLKQQAYKRWSLYTGLSLLAIFLIYLIYRTINHFIQASIEKRKRESEELLRLQREELLKDIDNASIDELSKLDDESRAALKLQEEINKIVKGEPDIAAKVVSLWINETNS